MGWGDELMAAGQAARAARETGRKVAILDRYGQARVHEIWQGLDFISPVRRADVTTIVNGPGCRPYIRYPFTERGHDYTGWRARDHRPVLSPQVAQRTAAEDWVLIEPTIKALANRNKFWPHWQAVVDALPAARFVQCRPPGEAGPALRGVLVVETPTFQDALRQLARARMFVGHEGGMHHAAAALGVPAVVVFGGSPSIEATGYPDHINFGVPDPCGRWEPCGHCAAAMQAITPASIAQAIEELLS